MTLSAARLATLIRSDVTLQRRYGFYAVYAFVTVAFALGLRAVPDAEVPRFFTLVVLSDPALLGFYFVGALVLFEKGEGVLDALVTTPVSVSEYLLSKVVSLTALALLVTFVIALLAVGTAFDPVVLFAAVALTVPFYVLVGFVAVARFDTLNAYFMSAIVYMTALSLPVVGLFGLVESPLFYLFPVQASLVLLAAVFEPASATMLAYGVGYLLVATAVAWVAARRAFVRHVVRGGDASGASEPAAPGGFSRVLGDRTLGPVGTMAAADLKKWVQDPLYVYIGLAPALLAVVTRFGTPYVAARLAGTFDIVPYYPLAVAFVVAFVPGMFGFVAGFFVLEERDQGLIAAFRTTPLTGEGYLRYRVLSVTLVSFAVTALTVPLAGLVSISPAVFVPVAAVAALWAAVSCLLMASLASNSVEGVAVSKALGILVTIPLFGIVFVQEPWQYALGVFPAFWTAKAFLVGAASGLSVEFAGLLAGGVVAHLVPLVVLGRRFLARED
ncbi:ABC transporter permease [Halopelagius longus]|uniref:ABC transporter permease n=1 Tax=Halopelagius longus TaxID=1236180 RepID=A0A1H0YY70_9EURY|nr:ABC transporter permease [Halopelagius longus]RDI72732.1 ABC transporter permease [Halopelagius longus]SDQ20094.1 fluoroquinolone transport system permease protein [Halopelagius longus]